MKHRLSGLGFRLMAVMGVALLPLALLSYVQAVQGAQLSESRITNAILGRTLVAAAPYAAEIVKAQGKAATLAAALPSVLRAEAFGDSQGCAELMDHVVDASIGRVAFAGYARADGQFDCVSDPMARSFSDSPVIADILADPGPNMRVSAYGPISKTSVLIFTHPVLNSRGQKSGVIVLSMPHAGFGDLAQQPEPDSDELPLSLITFDAGGTMLTASHGYQQAALQLPAGRSLADLAGTQGESFVAETVSGQRRAFAVVPLQPGNLYLIGSWNANRLDATVLEGAFPAFVFPTLMWAASLLVAWLAAEGQVLRHIRSLRDSITAFADGQRSLPALQMRGAARELQSVGNAYERMTAAIVHNEADLENTIHQKEVLLREVHHRVKNNLQLIASILNMQLRSARNPETREAMRTLQDRVISLATVHRELYQTSGLADVRADELLPRVSRDLLHIGTNSRRRFQLDAQVDALRLTPDQAVPLALFLTEGMANVIKHGWTQGPHWSTVGLHLHRSEAGMARLMLTNRLPPDPKADTAAPAGAWQPAADGFGTQLLTAFAEQLGGRITRGASGGLYTLTLDFPLRPLNEGEQRTTRGPGPAAPPRQGAAPAPDPDL